MKRAIFFIPAALYYALIFYLSSKSYKVEIDILLFDKGVHIAEFAVLGFLLSFGYFKSLKSSLKIKAVLIISTGIILGSLDELHQYFVPLRYSEVLDGIADALGIALGLFIYTYLSRKVKGRILE